MARRHAPVWGFSIDIKLLTLKLIERCLALYVMNSCINMKGCSSNNINRNWLMHNSKVYGKNLQLTKPCYSGHILPVPWPFVISRFLVVRHITSFVQKEYSSTPIVSNLQWNKRAKKDGLLPTNHIISVAYQSLWGNLW